MSAPEPYRPPAWAGLETVGDHLDAVEPALSARIAATLQRAGTVQNLRSAAGGATPFFRFLAANGADDFLKLVGAARIPAMRRAETIAQWLAERGAPVIAANDREPRMLDAGSGLYVYPYRAGRLARPDADDLAMVGSALAELHHHLAAHPDRNIWQAATQRRLQRLERIREMLAAGRMRSGPQPDRVARIAADTALDLTGDGPRVPLHGDLNLFNLIVDGGRVWFIDFEDVRHSTQPVGFELALICERLVLARENDAAAARRAIAAFLGAYRASGGHRSFDVSAFPTIIRSLSLRALCTLAGAAAEGQPVAEAEWGKFFHLSELAQSRRGEAWWPSVC
jgi:Ser/Thr protein kinase RdoA (MazF antagonist)